MQTTKWELYEYQRSRSVIDLGPNHLHSIFLNFFSSITADFNTSSAIRWAIQDQWSSGSCLRTAKALARLRGCAGSPESSLVAYVISTIISWAGSFDTAIDIQVWTLTCIEKMKWECDCPDIWATSWENLIMAYVNNKGTDQPAHLRSLISTFVVRFLDSIIPLLSISEISQL